MSQTTSTTTRLAPHVYEAYLAADVASRVTACSCGRRTATGLCAPSCARQVAYRRVLYDLVFRSESSR